MKRDNLVEQMRLDLNALLAEREELKSRLDSVVRHAEDLHERLIWLESKDAFDAPAKSSEENQDSPTEQQVLPIAPANPMPIPLTTQPDLVALQYSGMPRKSIERTPEYTGAIQLHEFDDAPSVGNLSIKREGKKLLLTDPDGTSGQRKWMVPLRRETTGAIELKWAQLGEGSDSDSDSDSDFPCQDEYTLDESDGDCGTTISLKRQAYKRGTGWQCEPDGDPEDAGSVTIPDPPEYRLSGGDGTGCKKSIQLQKKDCDDESWGDVGDAVEIDKPKTYTVELTSSAGACTKKYQLKETDCSGEETGVGTEIEVPTPPEYSLAEAQGSTPCLKKYQLTKAECGGSASPVDGAVTIEVPGKDSISATATGSTAGGAKAGTVTVTPCGDSPTNIDIYNGRDGKDGSDGDDGCSPTVSVDPKNPSPPTQKNQATLAATIEITPCGGQKQTINVYNGQDGEDGKDGSDGDDGVGIASIVKTGTSGLVDTYTITLTNGNTYSFTVTNGKDGDPGSDGDDGCTFTPSVAADGTLSWTNDCNRTNPPSVNIKGSPGDPGCSPMITAGTTPSDPGDTAYTITPCGTNAQPIVVYHGKNGTPGSTPVITATKSNGVTTIYADGVLIATVNDGTDGSPGVATNGTFVTSIGNPTVSGNVLTIPYTTVTYTNGVAGTPNPNNVATYTGTSCT